MYTEEDVAELKANNRLLKEIAEAHINQTTHLKNQIDKLKKKLLFASDKAFSKGWCAGFNFSYPDDPSFAGYFDSQIVRDWKESFLEEELKEFIYQLEKSDD